MWVLAGPAVFAAAVAAAVVSAPVLWQRRLGSQFDVLPPAGVARLATACTSAGDSVDLPLACTFGLFMARFFFNKGTATVPRYLQLVNEVGVGDIDRLIEGVRQTLSR